MLFHRLPDLDALLPNFGWVGKEDIHETREKTTQHYRANQHVPMRKHFRSCFPAAKVRHLPEWYSTYTFISDVAAHDDGIPGHVGCRLIHVYSGLDSELLAGYPMSSETDLPTTLKAFIHDYGAMEGLKSDIAKLETSFRMKNLFSMYLIKDKQSKPHYQHQNPIEHHIQDLKQMMHGIMDCVGFPPSFCDIIPSNTPGAEPARDARDSGSSRSHSTHLETSSQIDRKWSPTWVLRRYQAICPLGSRDGRYVCQISRTHLTHNRP